MDLSDPLSAIIPSAHGAVLAVLARTTEPLSGRKVAELTDGKVGQWRTSQVLGELAEAGVVLREHRPPAKFYRLNLDHVSAPGVLALVDMWSLLLTRIRDEVSAWEPAPVAVCLFGSAARGEASAVSDIDLLAVRDGDSATEEADGWRRQVDQLVEHVRLWSGNTCEILELSSEELRTAGKRKSRLAEDLDKDAVRVFGPDIRTLLGR